MHKLYKENILFEMSHKNINYVEQIASSVHFSLIIRAIDIECGDMITAKVVYNDVCENLLKDKNFAMVKKFLINFANVKDVQVKEDRIDVLYEDDNTIIFCQNKEESQSLYEDILNKIGNIKNVEHNT